MGDRNVLRANVFERLEVGEVRLEGLSRKTPRAQATCNVDRNPTEVDLEISQRCCNRSKRHVVENDETTGPNEFPEIIEIHKNFVKTMTSVEKSGVGRQSVCCEPSERDGRHITNECRLIRKSRSMESIQSNVIE